MTHECLYYSNYNPRKSRMCLNEVFQGEGPMHVISPAKICIIAIISLAKGLYHCNDYKIRDLIYEPIILQIVIIILYL